MNPISLPSQARWTAPGFDGNESDVRWGVLWLRGSLASRFKEVTALEIKRLPVPAEWLLRVPDLGFRSLSPAQETPAKIPITEEGRAELARDPDTVLEPIDMRGASLNGVTS